MFHARGRAKRTQPGPLPAPPVLSCEGTKRLRRDEEYRFPNAAGERSKKQSDFTIPGPQNRYRVARGSSCHPEPAYFRTDGAFQDAQKRPPLAQGTAADGGASPPVAGLPPERKSGAVQDPDSESWHPAIALGKRFSRAGLAPVNPRKPSSLLLIKAGRKRTPMSGPGR